MLGVWDRSLVHYVTRPTATGRPGERWPWLLSALWDAAVTVRVTKVLVTVVVPVGDH